MSGFHREIVSVNPRAELNFLNDRGVLIFLGLLVLFCLFVTELSKVHDPTNWRGRRGGNFHQIQACLAGEAQGVIQRHHPELFALGANDPDFTRTDFSVDPNERAGGMMT